MNGGLPSGARLQVVRGNPTTEELAAVVVAIDAVVGAEQASAPRSTTPAWRRAARIEAVGGRPLAGAADLRATRR